LGRHLKTYVELDFPELTTKKAMAVKKSKDLSAGLDQVTLSKSPTYQALQKNSPTHAGQGGTALHSTKYHLLPVDLRLDPSESLEPLLFSTSNPLLDPSTPTLLICECVLAYMPPEASARLLRWFVEKSQGALGCVVYEMFGLNDAFGRVMVNNLKVRPRDCS
jgi:[phosphatase 2A protein]-leucine-carboxy methyltransferase